MCRRARGSCIILPFPCETGGPPVPCVYALLSLTWCNGTCGNNSGGMASRRESVKTLRFPKTSLLQSEYHLCSNGWSVPLLCYRSQISYFLRFEPLREAITAVAMELNTFICTERHFFFLPLGCISGCIFPEFATSSPPGICLLIERRNTKVPKTLPFPFHFKYTNNGALRSHQWMCLGLFSGRNTCLLSH